MTDLSATSRRDGAARGPAVTTAGAAETEAWERAPEGYSQMPASPYRLVRVIDRTAELLAVLTMATMVVIMFWNAFGRKFLQAPLGWAEEVVTGLLLWLIAFGLYCATRRRELIVVRVVLGRFRPPTQVRLKMVTDAVAAVILTHLAWVGMQYVLAFGGDASAYLRIPKGVFTVAIPLVAAGVAIAIVLQMRSNAETVASWIEEEQSSPLEPAEESTDGDAP